MRTLGGSLRHWRRLSDSSRGSPGEQVHHEGRSLHISVRLQVPPQSPRAVRPRTGKPESEPSRDSRRSSSETPASWPNVASNLDDLPLSIRQHLERASQLAEQYPSTTASLAAGFFARHTEDNEKRVLRSIDFETASPETQEGLRKAMNGRNSFISEPLL